MTTLREAAQQALEAMNYSGMDVGKFNRINAACAALRAALAEPVQEPVAWQWLDTAHFRKKIPAGATPAHWRPLFTAPPQRKPLTEERNFCPRCGKRTRDIHTCTPPGDCDVHG